MAANRGPQLTAAEKADRDARAQYWMNQRKIERVAEAAARHGWYRLAMSAEAASDYPSGNHVVWSDAGGEWRVEEYDTVAGELVLRKVG